MTNLDLGPEYEEVGRIAAEDIRTDPEGTYLVTGGVGALGRRIAALPALLVLVTDSYDQDTVHEGVVASADIWTKSHAGIDLLADRHHRVQ